MAAEVADAAEDIVFKKRGPKKSARKRAATPPPNSDSEEDYSSEDEQGQRQVKRRKKAAGILTTNSKKQSGAQNDSAIETLVGGATKYSGDRSATLQDSNDATRQSNLVQMGAAPKVGPAKAAASNVRVTNYTDFAPDVCKDYKQTGFCGFGDSCKFLHAREDYKAGWQLDSEWDKFAQGKKEIGGKVVSTRTQFDKEDEDEDLTREEVELLEKVPFKCIICKEDYKIPIVTKCGHYYCEACALKRFRKSPSCAACGAGTNGVFNQAKGLKRLLEKKERREKRKREQEESEKAE